VQKRLFESYIRAEAYKYLRSKDFKRRAGITKKRPYLLIQPLFVLLTDVYIPYSAMLVYWH